MKRLLDTPITRQTRDGLGDWESAADQATDAGRNAFWLRQQARMKAQREAQKAPPSVVQIRGNGKQC